jgi:peroxiredoxin family protein
MEAVCLVAAGAVEMDVEVVVFVVVAAVTEFVADTFSRILQRVNETAAVEKLQCPENV